MLSPSQAKFSGHGFLPLVSAFLPVVMARSKAADGTAGSREHRPISNEAYFYIFLLTCVAVLCVVGMYLFQSKIQCRAEVLKMHMSENMSTDKYLTKILRHFSFSHVEDYIFHGISAKKERVSIRFNDISASVKGRPSFLPMVKGTKDKKIITGVGGEFAAGHVSAILGTSGAGKSTFLNVLSGKTQARKNWNVSGTVYVNGVEADLTTLKSVMGFVPQEDVVHERLTVRENIAFSAELRNRGGTSASRIRRITDDVLQVLQLEAQQNTIIGNRSTGEGLSGGQRKRVNVGIELAACPSLLFLDEPTSGLDATGSLMLVKQLQKMTQLGMTIVMVIHQPRYQLFSLIDDVLLLGKGGRTVYMGPTSLAKPYFEELGFTMLVNENPADWMMDVASGQNEIENTRISKDELPERLFSEWELKGDGVLNAQPEVLRQKTEFGGECDMLRFHLTSAWRQVDPSGTSTLTGEDFALILERCTGIRPELHIVHQLIVRSKQGVKGSPVDYREDTITLKEFECYLLAVHEGGVCAQPTEATPGLGPVDEEATIETEVSTESGMSDETDPECGGMKATRASSELHREVPGFSKQLSIVVQMRAIVWWRTMKLRLLFLAVVVSAALFLGIFDRYVFESPAWLPLTFINAFISLSLLTAVYTLQTFGSQEELPMYWREVSHGLSRAAHFIGRACVDILDVFLLVFTFVTTYYLVTAPLMKFQHYAVPFFFVSFVASGWGYVISCWLPYEFTPLGPFVSTLLCFVFGGILGLPNQMNIFLGSRIYEASDGLVSFTRWGVPMLFFEYIRVHPQNVKDMSLRNKYTYELARDDYSLAQLILPGDDNFWYTGILALSFMGCALRLLAFIGLKYTNKSQQV